MTLALGLSDTRWLEASARVEALLPEGVRVRVFPQSGCSGCASRQGCGTGLLASRKRQRPQQVIVHTSRALSVGQVVRIGLPARRFLAGTLAIYGLPLMGSLLAGVAAEAWLAPGHPLVPAAFVAGLAASWLGLAVWGRRQGTACRPVLLDSSPL